jgi:hypothetical protein
MTLEALIPSKTRTGIAALRFAAGLGPESASAGHSCSAAVKCDTNLGRAKMRYVALVIMAAALMLPAPAAHAIQMTFGGILSGANEVPPINSSGASTAVVVLDPTAQTIQIIAAFFGLTTPDSAAHIHCCGPLGMNVGVATTVPAFAGVPAGSDPRDLPLSNL